MTSLLMYLKQQNCIYICACLWLAYLAVVNAEGIIVKLQPKADEIGTSTEETLRGPRGILKTRVTAKESIEIAALGRPLSLGMLYDCRKDSFIPGVTLWDKKSLSENLDIHHQTETDLKFSSSDSLSSKSSLLDVSASLKASFLGGLVNVGGSGKFLHDTKASNQQSRVTMFHSETTRYEQLTMSQLSHFTYPEVFEQTTATHVVTAVLYGAQALMVFDRTFSEEENKQDIEGDLNVMVKSIPRFSIKGKGSVNMKEDEKNEVEKIACTFHGDVLLEQNPTTYIEALQTYKQLPALLKNPQNEVPIKVWLYPLHLLDSKAAQLEREITTSLISDTEHIIEELGEAERTCNDLFKNTLVSDFSDIKARLQLFQSLFSKYKTMLMEAVGRVLPAIRGGEMEDKSLEDILKIHRSSLFNADKLKLWLNDAKFELHILSHVTKSLEGIRIKDSVDIMTLFFNPNIDAVVCLTFTSLKYEDTYLSTLKKLLQSDMFKDRDITSFSVEPLIKWFSDPRIIIKMIENLSQFRRIAEANKDETRIRFIISAISNPNIAGSSIYLYEKGKLIETQFEPMSRPPPPIMRNVQAQAVSLKLQQSSSRERVHYRVEYKQVKLHSGAEEPWSSKDTYDEDFTLTGLEHGKHYLIRYRIVGKVGVSEASDTVSATVSANPFGTVIRFDGFFTTMKAMSWSDSRQFCRDHGGDLVIIKSTQKQRLVSSFVKEIGVPVWIGLSDLEKKGHMKWVDNSPLNQR
uniref:Verrucotoxin subunit beta-like n=2 Tax=Sinocyclocheilus rhinocerous TaxID=307959 RepID=A0A673H0J8_9TELE